MKKLMIVVGAVVLTAFGAEAGNSKMNLWSQASRVEARSAAGCERVLPGMNVPAPKGCVRLQDGHWAAKCIAKSEAFDTASEVLVRYVRDGVFEEDGSLACGENFVDGLMEVKVPRSGNGPTVSLPEFRNAREQMLESAKEAIESCRTELIKRWGRANNALLEELGTDAECSVKSLRIVSGRLVGRNEVGIGVVRHDEVEADGQKISGYTAMSTVIFWCEGNVAVAVRQAVRPNFKEAKAAHAESERILLDWVEAIQAASKGARSEILSRRTRVEEPEEEEFEADGSEEKGTKEKAPEADEPEEKGTKEKTPEADEPEEKGTKEKTPEAEDDEEDVPVVTTETREAIPHPGARPLNPMDMPVRSLPSFLVKPSPGTRSYPGYHGSFGGAGGFRKRPAATMPRW